MIPIKDENPVSSTPIITIIIIAINILVFLTEPLFESGPDAQFQEAKYFVCQASIPYEVTHGERIADARARGIEFEDRIDNAFAEIQRISCPKKNVWLSILVSMFLHGSILHIAGNMLFLWVFGNNVEDRLGKGKFIAFYLLSGVAATYAQSYVFPSSATPLVGASGAVAGILGAYLLMFPRARIRSLVILVIFITMIELPASIVIGLWFVMQLVSSVGSVAADTGVAYMAHVGGFLAGMILLLIFRPKPQRAVPQTYPY